MLQAIDSKGRIVTLYSLDAGILAQMKEEGQFYCPDCKEELIIRAGRKVTAHFAHRKKSACLHSGEGSYHAKGKLDLYQWLKKQGIEVFLEHYISEIKQRPDLLVKLGTRTLAIEYQCARISLTELRSRTEKYRQIGMIPVWILGANNLNRLSSQLIKITSHDAAYIHQFHEHFPQIIYYYCSSQKQLIFFQDFYFLTQTKAYGNFTVKPLEKCTFKEFFLIRKLPTQQLLQIWRKELKNWRNRPVSFHQRRETEWRKWLYLHKFNTQTIPYYVNIPVQSEFMMKTPPWIWQSCLYLDLIVKRREFSLKDAADLVHNHLYPARDFPLLHAPLHPVKEYFQLLERIGILKSCKQNVYVVVRTAV
ncbi:Competence protein CoiA-like family, contains a predicted nuclease domain [Gracilibacillus ureilyticus]|uniref:Competence protein CoiA-like family, contains a predicted nuclease domain n=1 Tax=Gracilibacillus ureilyticus TaxID=531814 RepID=A0A1H9SPP1_9BACI|nr:competence protein CoiA family protein [Gracilibacillus ureilyticus]SER86982.1 Competence protein CoiA-like family, contains a predicted nuclease domain [Gracilibacillus ureilyticus]